ncbi:MAG: hypothetical protein QXU82_02010 [Candidatus Aenigmatarchaeota archaeon]
MKNLLIAALVLALLAVPALAKADAGQGMSGQPESNDTGQFGEQQGDGSGAGEQIQEQDREQLQEQEQAGNVTRLREMIREREQELNMSLKEVRQEMRSAYENQNRVRVAVHALLSMENLTGGIGKNVSAIAKEFNNSVQSTLRAEEKIATRNAVIRFLFGGDEAAANDLINQTAQNSLRIRELEQLRDECDCSDEVKAEYDNQIRVLQQEQDRLRALAQEELGAKGLFGWMFR